jgi:hypothetical protein
MSYNNKIITFGSCLRTNTANNQCKWIDLRVILSILIILLIIIILLNRVLHYLLCSTSISVHFMFVTVSETKRPIIDMGLLSAFSLYFGFPILHISDRDPGMTFLGHPSSLHQYEHTSSKSHSSNSSLQVRQNQVRSIIRLSSLTIFKASFPICKPMPQTLLHNIVH